MNFISINGSLQPADAQEKNISKRGYYSGEGLFDTMKLIDGKIQLVDFHFDRLLSGMRLLRYEFPKDFSVENLTTEIVSLCGRNGVSSLARVRLSVIPTTYVIECWPLERSMTTLNENGLKLGIYPGGRKKCDELSNLKSSGDLIYINAAAYAEHQGWDDGLVMNEKGNIADSSISNLFIIKDGQIITPPLSEGCVSGVMRRFIMSRTSILEEPVDPDKLLTADEVFLTNAIRGIRWVKNFGNKTYSNQLTNEIYRQCM